jgi:hypothetical protein
MADRARGVEDIVHQAPAIAAEETIDHAPDEV